LAQLMGHVTTELGESKKQVNDMPDEIICPVCGVDIKDDLDPDSLERNFIAVDGQTLVRKGECPQCHCKIKVYLSAFMVLQDHDAENHRGAS